VKKKNWMISVLGAVLLTGLPVGAQKPAGTENSMDAIAESYVKLVLAVGQHDPDYVDAYYGPAEWQAEAKAVKQPLDELKTATAELITRLRKIPAPRPEEASGLRYQYVSKQLESVLARIELLAGRKMRFDQEAKSLYDADPPVFPESHFRQILDELEKLLPGPGTIAQKYQEFKNRFVIPGDRLDAVFTAAIREARRRTLEHIQLPADETFRVEYVKNKSWSGYNWYQGNYHSLIQVNTDLPIFVDYAVDLACHEGYPGHHVYNILLEKNLLRENRWIEFSVYPLFSPQSLIAEGTANFGIEVAFPGEERVAFERDVIFSAAGLDGSLAQKYYAIAELVAKLNFAGNEAARHYLDGDTSAEEAIRWLEAYALMSPERARQRLRFIEQYRSYVINYNYGLDLVRNYITARGGTSDQPVRRWQEFEALISSPRLPSSLRQP
jgi:hypothetical protein